MAEMLQIGDPLADAVIAEINELGKEASGQLNKGIIAGLDSLDNPPPAIAAFLTELETLPEWVDRAALQHGEVSELSVPPLWKVLASGGTIELSHVYASPAIAKLLVQTGSLAKMAPRRLAETGLWKQQVVLPGGLLRGAPGYVSTAQVRLLHARVRATSMNHGWEHRIWGVPINQTDIARTWLAFTRVASKAWDKLGIDFTEEEQATRYRYWWYIGYVLGLDERFYSLVRTDADADALLDLLDTTIAEPDENSRELTLALLDANVEQLAAGPLSMMDRATLRDLFHGMCRDFLGDRFADSLQLPPAQAAAIIPLLAAASTQSWQLQHSTEENAALTLEKFTATAVAIAAEGALEDGTAYEKNAAA
ncbi:oxygenase MpaB family protein [Mycobacterium sp. URHB0044]|uniref:oxygenase MpaB family protein n=1 Tax=Mycobacterium sp. URHB0044 TaxID=1380386 RepID=UPI000AC4C05B|nr:oxygenase MpaB family protein [Mycobacterium sp. URHB0044]